MLLSLLMSLILLCSVCLEQSEPVDSGGLGLTRPGPPTLAPCDGMPCLRTWRRSWPRAERLELEAEIAERARWTRRPVELADRLRGSLGGYRRPSWLRIGVRGTLSHAGAKPWCSTSRAPGTDSLRRCRATWGLSPAGRGPNRQQSGGGWAWPVRCGALPGTGHGLTVCGQRGGGGGAPRRHRPRGAGLL